MQFDFEFGDARVRRIAFARHPCGLGERLERRQFRTTRTLQGGAALCGQLLFTTRRSKQPPPPRIFLRRCPACAGIHRKIGAQCCEFRPRQMHFPSGFQRIEYRRLRVVVNIIECRFARDGQ